MRKLVVYPMRKGPFRKTLACAVWRRVQPDTEAESPPM